MVRPIRIEYSGRFWHLPIIALARTINLLFKQLIQQ